MHHYEPPEKYDAGTLRAWLSLANERARKLERPLFLAGIFGMLVRWEKTPDGFDDAAYRTALTDYFNAVFESGTPLAAYWAFAPDSRPYVGTLGPDYRRFDFILDLIAAYNRKCAQSSPLEFTSSFPSRCRAPCLRSCWNCTCIAKARDRGLRRMTLAHQIEIPVRAMLAEIGVRAIVDDGGAHDQWGTDPRRSTATPCSVTTILHRMLMLWSMWH